MARDFDMRVLITGAAGFAGSGLARYGDGSRHSAPWPRPTYSVVNRRTPAPLPAGRPMACHLACATSSVASSPGLLHTRLSHLTEDMIEPPSFKGLAPSSSAQSRAKRSNRARDTKPELLVRRELWARGARYRLFPRDVPGCPDIVFRRARVAVFCDGDFWHGRDWPQISEKLASGHNGSYWTAKIAYNIERDIRINQELEQHGWLVLRYWESAIKASPSLVATAVLKAVSAQEHSC